MTQGRNNLPTEAEIDPPLKLAETTQAETTQGRNIQEPFICALEDLQDIVLMSLD